MQIQDKYDFLIKLGIKQNKISKFPNLLLRSSSTIKAYYDNLIDLGISPRIINTYANLLIRNPDSMKLIEDISIINPLRLKRIIPSIINKIPTISPFFNVSPRILMEPIARTINPALMSPGTNAGPRKACASI